MDKQQLLNRTKAFALDIIDFVSLLPNNNKGNIISRQILKSGTSDELTAIFTSISKTSRNS